MTIVFFVAWLPLNIFNIIYEVLHYYTNLFEVVLKLNGRKLVLIYLVEHQQWNLPCGFPVLPHICHELCDHQPGDVRRPQQELQQGTVSSWLSSLT